MNITIPIWNQINVSFVSSVHMYVFTCFFACTYAYVHVSMCAPAAQFAHCGHHCEVSEARWHPARPWTVASADVENELHVWQVVSHHNTALHQTLLRTLSTLKRHFIYLFILPFILPFIRSFSFHQLSLFSLTFHKNKYQNNVMFACTQT